jgi:hypothetical protein
MREENSIRKFVRTEKYHNYWQNSVTSNVLIKDTAENTELGLNASTIQDYVKNVSGVFFRVGDQ